MFKKLCLVLTFLLAASFCYAQPSEVLDRRTENSKDYFLGGNKFQRVITGQPQHYKDDYKDAKEAWKDIDLTIVKGRVDKAPFILVIDGNKYTVTDKKTGKTSVVELLKVGDTTISKTDLSADSKSTEIIKDVDYDLVFNETKIKFQRTIKTAEALKEATFKIMGDIPVVYSAVDADGDAVKVDITQDKDGNVVESFVAEKTLISTADGKITETKVAPTYPIKIDPILTITGSGKDTELKQNEPTLNRGTETSMRIEGTTGQVRRVILEMPLTDLPAGATLSSATLSLYYVGNGGDDGVGEDAIWYKLRRTNWLENESTWNIYKSGSNWGTAGCANTSTDIDTSKSSTLVVPASYGWMAWNVLTMVQDAVANSVAFEGRLHLNDTAHSAIFRSKEYADDTSLRPKLAIEYTTGFIPKIIFLN